MPQTAGPDAASSLPIEDFFLLLQAYAASVMPHKGLAEILRPSIALRETPEAANFTAFRRTPRTLP
jgi:hypothetical protein